MLHCNDADTDKDKIVEKKVGSLGLGKWQNGNSMLIIKK
jgi:hypothetical protein